MASVHSSPKTNQTAFNQTALNSSTFNSESTFNASTNDTSGLGLSVEDSPKPSTESTLIEETEEIQHPRPMKPIHSHSHFHRHFDSSSPNNNSNSSVLSGVGIGNNYFNFTNKEHYEPIFI